MVYEQEANHPKRANCNTGLEAAPPSVMDSINRTIKAMGEAERALDRALARLTGSPQMPPGELIGGPNGPRTFQLVNVMHQQSMDAERVMRLAETLACFVGV